ncbi:MAG TPA: helix-turn-helix domain-containing protein [Pseudonocardiaceae bacterium]|nr:helix-turn-helix domain-containing protein [Pseudonocardiaceae bacterium]
MGRPERPLEPGDDDLVGFAGDLRALRELAGRPSYRELAGRAHYSATTLSDAAGGRILPSLAVTLAYVAGCGGDLAEWEQRWHALAVDRAAPAHPTEPDNSGPAPYIGTAVFEPADADRFFGRGAATDTLLGQVRTRRFVAVVGASGAGKSSLLNAGLIARTTNDEKPVVRITPGSDPIAECAIALGSLTGLPAIDLRAALLSSHEALHFQIRQLVADRPRGTDVLLVIDQFEELFTLCRDERRRDVFIAALGHAVGHPESRLRVVVGLRSDFYPYAQREPGLRDLLADSQVPLGPMSAQELRCAITEPAGQAGYVVEGALLAAVMADVAGQAGALPLLSNALLETWRRRRGTTLTLGGYQAGGGITHAIAGTAEQVYAGLAERDQRLAKTLFLRLTAADDDTDATRRVIHRDDLDLTDQHTAALLEQLVRARLITVDHDQIELAHDALIRCWPRLPEWLAADRAGLRVHRQLANAARTWEVAGHDQDTVYRGRLLAVARDWAAGSDAVLSPRERAFLSAGQAAEFAERGVSVRRTRQLRFLVTLLSVLLLVAATTIGFAVAEQRATIAQHDIAVAQDAFIQAEAMLNSDPALAEQILLAAYQLAPNEQTRNGLLNALTASTSLPADTVLAPQERADLSALDTDPAASPFLPTGSNDAYVLPGNDIGIEGRFANSGRLWVLTNPLRPRGNTMVGGLLPGVINVDDLDESTIIAYPAAFDPWTDDLATGGPKGGVLWHLRANAQPTRVAALPGVAMPVAFSPDGQTLAAIGVDGTAQLWNANQPDQPYQVGTLAVPDQPGAMAFSPDSGLLATASLDGRVRLWDVTDPARPRLLAAIGAGTDTSLAFAPDGRTLAMGAVDGTVRLWQVSTPTHPVPLATLDGSQGIANTVVFSPNGSTLAVAAGGETTRVWDVHDPGKPGLIGALTDAVDPVAFASDGHSLAGLDRNARMTMWETDPNRVVAQICATVSEGNEDVNFDESVWRRYFPGVPFDPPCTS